MISMRSWSWILCGLLVSGAVGLQACSKSEEPAKAPAAAPAAGVPAAAPAAPAAGQPPAAPAAGANAGANAMVVDELYVDAEADPDEGTPPLSVKFNSTVEDATGAVTCEWDFGDGTAKSTDMNPSHTYDKVGDYVATLRCKDSKGIEGETEIDVTAYEEE